MLVYQRDVRVWLREESARERRPVTLESLPAGRLEELADRGFQALWLRGLWRPEESAVAAAQRSARTLEACLAALPDLELDDIEGPYQSARDLVVEDRWGGREGVAELRDELLRRGLRLIVDLPRLAGGTGVEQLEAAAAAADGVFVCSEVLAAGAEAWSAALRRVRGWSPRFLSIAEAPATGAQDWLDRGFDHVLDASAAAAWRAAQCELAPSPCGPWGDRLVRGLELDGDRAARVLEPAAHEAAAVLAYIAPGLRVVADGELEGRSRPAPPCLVRRAHEEPHRQLASFHERLLEVIAQIHPEERRLEPLAPRPAWEGSETWRSMAAYLLVAPEAPAVLVAVNRGPELGQCFVDLSGRAVLAGDLTLADLFSLATYERPGAELAARGLYLELEGWDYNVFLLERRASPRHAR
jgi:hypothetical protein